MYITGTKRKSEKDTEKWSNSWAKNCGRERKELLGLKKKGYLLCVKHYFRYRDPYFHTHTNTHICTWTLILEKWDHCSAYSVGDPQKLKLFRLRLGDNCRLVSLFIHFGANIPWMKWWAEEYTSLKLSLPLFYYNGVAYSWILISKSMYKATLLQCLQKLSM